MFVKKNQKGQRASLTIDYDYAGCPESSTIGYLHKLTHTVFGKRFWEPREYCISGGQLFVASAQNAKQKRSDAVQGKLYALTSPRRFQLQLRREPSYPPKTVFYLKDSFGDRLLVRLSVLQTPPFCLALNQHAFSDNRLSSMQKGAGDGGDDADLVSSCSSTLFGDLPSSLYSHTDDEIDDADRTVMESPMVGAIGYYYGPGIEAESEAVVL